MSLPFFRNLICALAISAACLPAVAGAQGSFASDGRQMMEAVRDRDITKVEAFLNDPASSNLVNTREVSTLETPLHAVAALRDAAWISYLIGKGANPNMADKEGVTPLMVSTRLGHIEGVTALLRGGARVDPVTSTGETPLIFAVHKRDIPLVRVLLANGASPDRADNSGRSARDYVALIGERRLSEEFASAEKARQSASAQQYGPSL